MTSPKVAAQASKCSRPRFFSPSGSRKLHGVHLDHRVGDRRAGGEGDAVAGVLFAQVAGFHKHVEARSEPPVWMPATRSIFVGVSRFLKECASSMKT